MLKSPKKSVAIAEHDRKSFIRSANNSPMKSRATALPGGLPSNKELRKSMMMSGPPIGQIAQMRPSNVSFGGSKVDAAR